MLTRTREEQTSSHKTSFALHRPLEEWRVTKTVREKSGDRHVWAQKEKAA